MWSTVLYLIFTVWRICTVSSYGTGRPQSRCEKLRLQSMQVLSSYKPSCNKDGTFARRQCRITLVKADCWYVDIHGVRTGEKDKTYYIGDYRKKTSPLSSKTRTVQPMTNDANSVPVRYTNNYITTENEVVETNPITTWSRQPITGTPLTRCQKLRKRRLETKRTVIPICTSDGHFQREQCNVNKTKCWCVGKTGKRIPGTKVRHQFPNCYPDVCGKRFEKLPSRQRRVVGGRASVPHTWPWQALVLFSDPKHICGGTLIRRNWLVTAASCFDNYPKRNSEWNVKLGVHKLHSGDENKLSVEAIHLHPNYKQGNATHPGDYDVALIQVSSSTKIPSSIMPLCLPKNVDFYKPGARCSITGWGHTSYNGSLSRVLREAWVDLVSLNKCNSEKSYNGTINERFMCAGYKEGGMDACHFDTGGPLACPVKGGVWTLAGIISWRQSCAKPHKYGVYTNVHKVKPWIEKIIMR